MTEQCFVCCGIQNYVEELLRLRESQLADVQAQHGRVSESLQVVETERKTEKVELETVVVELQSQLSVFDDPAICHCKHVRLQLFALLGYFLQTMNSHLTSCSLSVCLSSAVTFCEI